MTQISDDDVAHLATLSAISVDGDEVSSLRGDLDAIVKYIEQLSELNTDGVEPTYQVTGLENIFRDDVIVDSGVSTEALLAGAPEQMNSQFKVPKVL